MAHILSYKGYEGTVDYDPDGRVLRGKILHIQDLVTYQSADCEKIEQEFQNSVDDYLELCADIGKQPNKPLSGQFNVRIPPDLHKKLAIMALKKEISLNAVVVQAIDSYVNSESVSVEKIADLASDQTVMKLSQNFTISHGVEKHADFFSEILTEKQVIRVTRGEEIWQ